MFFPYFTFKPPFNTVNVLKLGSFIVLILLTSSCRSANSNTNTPKTPSPPQTSRSEISISSKSGKLVGGETIAISGSSFLQSEAGVDKRSLGIGLAGINDYSPQFPFLDQFKVSRKWISQQEGKDWGDGDPLDLDDRGWVKSLKPGQSADRILINVKDKHWPFKRYVVRYEGSGKMTYGRNAIQDESASSPNRDVIEVNPERGSMTVLTITETDPNDYIRNITVVPEEYLDEYDRGEIFNPLFLQVIDKFRAIRFMDWMRTNHSEQSEWRDRPKVEDLDYRYAGVPIEIMVALANKIHADPWFNMPHLATEEYMQEFAKYVRDNLDPDLTVYVEHSNEVWNWGFEQAQYANKTGRQRWAVNGDPEKAPGNSYMQWHGMRTAQMCDIWKGVFAGQTHRVHCTLGIQKGWEGLEQGALNCPKWVEEGNEACYKHGIDSIAITTYFSGCLNGKKNDEEATAIVRSWFSEPDGGLTKGMEQIENAAHFPCKNTSSGDDFSYHKQVADEYELQLLAYEGGQHITGNSHPTQNDEDFIKFHIGLNRDARMYDRYQEMLNNWKNSGGALMMHFVDIATPSKFGSWGALEYLTQGSSPKYDALVDFNDRTECWWQGCGRLATAQDKNALKPKKISVKIGDRPCRDLRVVGDDRLICTTPKGEALGSVNVTVEVEGKTIDLPEGFTYVE
ncbi:MAG TPA: cellulose-binding protein [Oscillatoriales cyanobacterium M59_W2019_021]|nr:cellulose-binding protein [Oscillatoriales cyanobacterium M4454_W2019_049]HIK49985.1 cellulose-binding protein [Oscillatoriales cyanobacterium M59_W2019_021]